MFIEAMYNRKTLRMQYLFMGINLFVKLTKKLSGDVRVRSLLILKIHLLILNIAQRNLSTEWWKILNDFHLQTSAYFIFFHFRSLNNTTAILIFFSTAWFLHNPFLLPQDTILHPA